MSRRGTRQVQLATRGSDLAMRQAGMVKSALEDRRHEVELVEVETTGDRLEDALIDELGKTGAFVRSLDELVLDGDVDGAVHSMKDMPTEKPPELIVAGVPQRENPGDVLVTPDGRTIDELEPGAIVGTSSYRRKSQILHHRSDLDVQPLRGNVDTRVEKLLAPALQREHQDRSDAEKERKGNVDNEDFEPRYDQTVEEWFDTRSEIERRALGRDVETEYDAIVLARAGLERSGLIHSVEFQPLSTDEFVPAAGQGALAITSLDNETAESIHSILDHPRTRVETTVERTVLAELNGGCIAPIGVHAVIQGEYVHVEAQVLGLDGEDVVELSRDIRAEHHVEDAKQLATELRNRGAAELVEAAREERE